MRKLLEKLLKKFDGLYYRQEYLCLSDESFSKPLHAYLVDNRQVIKDISGLHLFTGYSPLIFAFSSSTSGGREDIQIVFSQQPQELNTSVSEKGVVASLAMKKVKQVLIDGEAIDFFEGTKGAHRFIGSVHQRIGRWHNRLFNRKPGNVFLNGNLYSQVQVAYSIPRKISLITVGHDGLFNHFPTDLHGKISNRHYIISLRHEGKACSQVEAAGKIVLSDIQPSACKKAFLLGKNHMQPLKERENFDFGPGTSTVFQLPLPGEVISYKELRLESTFIYGIHKLLLFKIVNEESVIDPNHTLCHIHNTYATWRHKKGLRSNYFMR
jgi:hypothetical protein